MAVATLDPHTYLKETSSGKLFEDIVSIVDARRSALSPTIKQMIEVKRRYNGDYVVPLPNLEDAPELPPLTPSLIADAIDHTAMRASSVMPMIFCPAVDPGKERGSKSRERAAIRRKTLASTYHYSRMKLLLRRAYRHLSGYATASLLVLPDFKAERPRIVLRDPLTSFPEPKAPEDYSEHENVAFIYRKSAAWLVANYPQTKSMITGAVSELYKMWDCVEWIDREEVVLGIMGPAMDQVDYGPDIPHRGMMELARYPNRAEMVPAVIPARVTLDRIGSQVANLTGIVDLMAKLTALDIIATEKSIWPDRYLIGRQNGMPQVVGGHWKGGETGEPNILQDVENVGELRSAPDPNNKNTLDRLERNFRVSAGLVPAMGGETYGSLRTGKGIDSMMDVSVQGRVQELQEILEGHLPELNRGIFAVYEGYWPDRKFVHFSGWPGDVGHVEFVPQVHLAETHDNIVSYAIPGADVQGLTVALGQLRGAKAISAATFRSLHPWIGDPDGEGQRVLEEDLEEALRVSLLERASQGGIPPEDMATIEQFIKDGDDIVQAVIKANRLAQERQATSAPPPDPTAGQVAPPGTQPGLANPGEGQEQPAPPEAIQPPAASQQNLRQLLLALRAGSNLRDSSR